MFKKYTILIAAPEESAEYLKDAGQLMITYKTVVKIEKVLLALENIKAKKKSGEKN